MKSIQVENLLAEIENEEASSEGVDSTQTQDNRCRSLERLASEISRLNFYYAKGQVNFVRPPGGLHSSSTSLDHGPSSAVLESVYVDDDQTPCWMHSRSCNYYMTNHARMFSKSHCFCLDLLSVCLA